MDYIVCEYEIKLKINNVSVQKGVECGPLPPTRIDLVYKKKPKSVRGAERW